MSFFFFSSRKRHSGLSRDWSSDLCSSDLVEFESKRLRDEEVETDVADAAAQTLRLELDVLRRERLKGLGQLALQTRSEERRVGKECRARRWVHAAVEAERG